ncbi:cytochrome P450 [Xylariales sp. AK1849]|nr:cytochrome P450 [Xylariales sp. AK1849]
MSQPDFPDPTQMLYASTALGIFGFTVLGVLWFLRENEHARFPLMGTNKRSGRLSKAKDNFAENSYSILSQGMKQCKGPFRVMTATGMKIVLPTRYLEQIKSDDRFSFAHEMAKQSLSHLSGFEAFATPLHDNIFQDTIRIKITQSLGAITEPLSKEVSFSLQKLLGDSAEWKQCDISKAVLGLTTRLSNRVFLGGGFSRNEKWLNLSLAYTMTAMQAAQTLLQWPGILQPLLNRVLPICVRQRAMLQSIRDLLEPEILSRKKMRAAMLQKGEKPPPGQDTIDWMDEIAQGRRFDIVFGQLQLGFVAIHTTSMLMTDVLLDLCAFPEYVPSLRQEIIDVLQESGWKKTAMHKLKKMDSFIKETLRLRPQSMITARRMATDTVTFPDGTRIPKGSSIMIPTITAMLDPAVYPEPEKFDGERFFRLRAQNESKAQLVTTSIDYLGFGLGKHACPGRFLAANEIKVALCHLLLKYDFKFLAGEGRPEPMTWETAYMTNPMAKILVRRREEEIDLE